MMKKGRLLSILLLTIWVVVAFSVVASADEEMKVKGAVSKIDMVGKSITIKPKNGDAVTIVMQEEKYLNRVKENDKAEVRYVVVDGANSGTKIRKLTGGCE